VDPSSQCCPQPPWAYRGGVGLGHIRAHGPPNGGPWRQRHGPSGGGACQETYGTPLHGTRGASDRCVGAVGAWAAGRGLRAGARVVEVAPKTGRPWRVAAAAQLDACSQDCLPAGRVTQGPLDALFALRSAVKAGTVSEAEASERLSRSPHGLWGAMAPVTTRRLALDVGDRTRARAHAGVQQVVQVVAPGCLPRCRTEGCKA
jgi:hypothetical protein